MNFLVFLKDKIFIIISELFAILFISILLSVTKTNKYIVFFIILILILVNTVCLCYEYLKKASFYKNMIRCRKELDKKYLLCEIINSPDFLEGEILYDTLKISNKAMNDHIAIYKLAMEEYREYIETWVHEIKTPISSNMLIIENNQNEVTKSIEEEINKINAFVEQALFYSRSNTVEKDYVIKEYNLQDIVTNVIKNNSKILIQNNILINIEKFSYIVFTDGKWIDFILKQIINNSIKYKSEYPFIKCFAKENNNSISLFIEDNGIGIPKHDISRVFEKGFTGENGRKFSKSTGIGLYLCKKLCNKLGLEINIFSANGTTVEIVFPIGSLTNM